MWPCRYFLYFLLVSVFGWIFETVYGVFVTGEWENRGFLYGPVCPIYGVGAVTIMGLMHFAEKWNWPVERTESWKIFLIAFFGSIVLEYGTHLLLEKLFHAYWWDYSNIPFNINGRVCLPASLLFGIGGILVVNYLAPFLNSTTKGLQPVVIELMGMASLCLGSIDTALTVSALTDFDKRVARINDSFNGKMEDFVGIVESRKEGIAESLGNKRESLTLSLESRKEGIAESLENKREGLALSLESRKEGIAESLGNKREGLALSLESRKEGLAESLGNKREGLALSLESRKEDFAESMERIENAIDLMSDSYKLALSRVKGFGRISDRLPDKKNDFPQMQHENSVMEAGTEETQEENSAMEAGITEMQHDISDEISVFEERQNDASSKKSGIDGMKNGITSAVKSPVRLKNYMLSKVKDRIKHKEK